MVPHHVPHCKVLDTYDAVALGNAGRQLVQEVFPDVADAAIEACNVKIRFRSVL